jgi:predicted PurR-regulated permease PerM
MDLMVPLGKSCMRWRRSDQAQQRLASIDRALWVIVVLLVTGVLYVARLFLLPIVLAVLFALTLSPLVRFARRRGIPGVLTASGLVVSLSMIGVVGAYLVSGPMVSFVERAPIIILEVNRKLSHLREPLETMSQASEQLAELTEGDDDPTVQDVRVREGGMLLEIADEVAAVLAIALVTVVLTLFLLVYNTLVYEKIVQAVPRFADKKIAVQTIHAMEREISRYLLSISIINFGLGVAVTTAMWLLEMPSPYLWGLMAALLEPDDGEGMLAACGHQFTSLHLDPGRPPT